MIISLSVPALYYVNLFFPPQWPGYALTAAAVGCLAVSFPKAAFARVAKMTAAQLLLFAPILAADAVSGKGMIASIALPAPPFAVLWMLAMRKWGRFSGCSAGGGRGMPAEWRTLTCCF